MQDRKPLVSVIMPSLNVVKYIDECIQSVLNQSLKEIEIICVDAGSTDGTYERLKEYETNDSRVRVILSDKRSYGYQVNLGIKESKMNISKLFSASSSSFWLLIVHATAIL